MIMILAALLAAQASAVPAQDKPPAPVTVEDLLYDYDGCIQTRLGVLSITGDQVADQRRVERAMRGCREQRVRAIAEAERLLGADPQFADPSARARHVEEAFAEADARQLERVPTIYRQTGNAMHRSTRPLRGETSTDSLRNLDRPTPSGTTSIDVPFQIMPAFMDYTACIDAHFAAIPGHDSHEQVTVRRAYAEAVTQCRPVRAQQLARAHAALNEDYRPFANARAARQAADEAFVRAERDFEIEPAPATPTKESPNADNQ